MTTLTAGKVHGDNHLLAAAEAKKKQKPKEEKQYKSRSRTQTKADADAEADVCNVFVRSSSWLFCSEHIIRLKVAAKSFTVSGGRV